MTGLGRPGLNLMLKLLLSSQVALRAPCPPSPPCHLLVLPWCLVLFCVNILWKYSHHI